MATNLGAQGYAYLELKDGRNAVAAYKRALAIAEQALEGDPAAVANHLTGLGQALLRIGNARGALKALERGYRMVAEAAPIDRAELQFALARALWASGGDRTRARSLARAARAAYAASTMPERRGMHGREAARVDRWLARSGP